MLILIGISFILLAILTIRILTHIRTTEQDIQQINTDLHDITHRLLNVEVFKAEKQNKQKGGP